MLERVISGGQSGVDQAGLRAARAAGIPTGGFAPRGWIAEEHFDFGDGGPRRWLHRPQRALLEGLGLVEGPDPAGPIHSPSDGPAYRSWCARAYKARTVANARAADRTVWLGSMMSPG